MKKLFVLFLLVALVPFSVGCSLWGHDEDLDVIAKSPVALTVKVPAAGIAGASLKGAISYQTLRLTIGGYEFTPGTPTGPVDGLWTIVFSASLTDAQQATLIDSTADTAVITSTLDTTKTILSFPVTLTSLTSVVVAVAEDGTVKVNDVTVPATDVTEGTFDVDTYNFEVTSVQVNAKDVATKTADIDNNVVTTLTPTFTLTFDAAPANLTTATWKVIVSSITVNGDTVTTVKEYTLDSSVAAEKALFDVAAVDGDTTKATVKINASTTDLTKNLESGKTYKVQISANNLYTGTSTSPKYLNTPVPFYFKVTVQ